MSEETWILMTNAIFLLLGITYLATVTVLEEWLRHD